MQLFRWCHPSRTHRAPRTHRTPCDAQYQPARPRIHQFNHPGGYRSRLRPFLRLFLLHFLYYPCSLSTHIQTYTKGIPQAWRQFPLGHIGRQQQQYGRTLPGNGRRPYHRISRHRLFRRPSNRTFFRQRFLFRKTCGSRSVPADAPYRAGLLLPPVSARPRNHPHH